LPFHRSTILSVASRPVTRPTPVAPIVPAFLTIASTIFLPAPPYEIIKPAPIRLIPQIVKIGKRIKISVQK